MGKEDAHAKMTLLHRQKVEVWRAFTAASERWWDATLMRKRHTDAETSVNRCKLAPYFSSFFKKYRCIFGTFLAA